MPSRRIEDPVAQAADPYWQRDRQIGLFGEDLLSHRILAVLVRIQNRGERTLVARPSDVLLRLPDGTRISTAGPSAVASLLQRRGLYPLSVMSFGIFGTLVTNVAVDRARWDREADLKEKGLPEKPLGPGDTAHGFVLFISPSRVQPFTEATLEVRFVDVESGFSFVVPLPLVLHDSN